MQAHYPLVDDLMSREEFSDRVEKVVKNSGGMLDESTAAMLVVREAGREHLKIRALNTPSSLVSFFGKVLGKTEPKEFSRTDDTPGLVVRVRVGDETGEADLVFWDERADAVASEVETGDVFEIVGRVKSAAEVNVMDMQKVACDIRTRGSASETPAGPETIEVCLLHMGEVRSFVRKDGSTGESLDCVIGSDKDTGRLICWEPAVLEGFSEGDSLRITGGRLKEWGGRRECSIGNRAEITRLDEEISVPFTSVAGISAEACSVRGVLSEIQPPHAFTTKAGRDSFVRNGVLKDDSGSIHLVLWGDLACTSLLEDDNVELYNVQGKKGRFGIELHAGWGSAISLVRPLPEKMEIEGTVIMTASGRCLDDGTTSYLLDGDLPLGAEVRVRGILEGSRLRPEECEAVSLSRSDLLKRAEILLSHRTVDS